MIHSNVFTIVLAFLSLFLLSACNLENSIGDNIDNPEVNEDSKEYPLAEQRLWIHFENFEKAALARNIILDLEELEITGSISDIPEDGVAGTCRYGSHVHHVTIDQAYWNSVSELQREMVVFHELGHCVLGIGHREADNGEGICLSMMNSGTTDCRVVYNSENRNYYLNELFEEEN